MASDEPLLWVDVPEGRPQRMTTAVRRHVMYAYGKQQSLHGPGQKRRSAAQKKGATRTLLTRQAMDPRLPTLAPANALVHERDRLIHYSAWWHDLDPTGVTQPEVAVRVPQYYRRNNRQQFWAMAQQDEIVMELFMAFAAAKESKVTGQDKTRPYLEHKASALTMIQHRINFEKTHGSNWKLSAAIGMLAYAALSEGDYAVAEQHLQAIVRVFGRSEDELQFAPFLPLAMVDTRLCGIYRRAPLLPQHGYTARICRRKDFVDHAAFLAMCNEATLPTGGTFFDRATGVAVELLRKLHEMAFILSNPIRDYRSVGPLLYITSYQIADLQMTDFGDDALVERIFLLGCQMQYWGMQKFIAQTGIQGRLYHDMAELLHDLSPQLFLQQWRNRNGGDSMLLWILCNTAMSAFHADRSDKIWHFYDEQWLKRDMRFLIAEMKITSADEFERQLKEMPYDEHWNQVFYSPIYLWLQISSSGPLPNMEKMTNVFSDLRIIFD